MGKILPSYTKELIQELIDSVISNTSHYYAFGSNPVAYANDAPDVANNDYDISFINNWQMMFGKKITGGDVVPVIEKNTWIANNVYSIYNNVSDATNLNNDFYVITEPSIVGGSYHVYKCIDNANNSYSTINPSSISIPTQPTTFKTSDNYKWRYIYSISSKNYEKFSSTDYVPVYTNATISATATNYSGVEVVQIVNGGIGYSTYHNGVVLANPNNSLLQIDNTASENNDFYVNNSIYIYNTFDSTAQITDIVDYVANTSGKFVFVNPTVNTATINPSISQYKISPKVKFETDGDNDPVAYSVINTTSNSIQSIEILDIGTNISWANVKIQSNTAFGSGANLYAIVPPPGGHGFDPETELNVKGFAVAFTFANTENNTIPTSNVLYNKIGIIKNPYTLSANISTGTITKTTRYTSNTFDQTLKCNVSPTYAFNVGENVIGNTSGSRGTVVFSNSTVVHLSGDKTFIDGELISNNAGNFVTTIAINEVGDIYTKDLKPLYVENINNINRIDGQTESYRLTIKF
jgi:hypothetical protein